MILQNWILSKKFDHKQSVDQVQYDWFLSAKQDCEPNFKHLSCHKKEQQWMPQENIVWKIKIVAITL